MTGSSLKQWAGGQEPSSTGASPVMEKPTNGDFLCSSCRHLSEDGKRCGSPDYRAYMGTDVLPRPADQMCSNWFEDREGRDLALAPVASEPPTQ